MARLLSLLLLVAGTLAIFYWIFDHEKNPAPLAPANLAHLPMTWVEYTAPKGQFHVVLPDYPHHSVDAIVDPDTHEIREYEIYIAAAGSGSVYSINLISFPQNKAAVYDDSFLESYVNKLLMSNPKNVLKKLDKTSYNHGSAVDFSVETENRTLNGKAFMKGATLYVLSTTSPGGQEIDPREFDLFLNSFQLNIKRD